MKRFAVLILCCFLLCAPVRAAENAKLVALTFEDGPSGRFTQRLLDGLAERDAKATFLLCGYSHKSMKDMCQRDTAQEIRKTTALLPDGCEVSFLRPPGGLCSACAQTVAEEFGLSILHWSVYPQNWAILDAKTIKAEVIRHVRDGDVILLHDMSDSSVNAAFAIIDELQEHGFRFITASELVQARSITFVPGKTYTRFQQTDSQEAK